MKKYTEEQRKIIEQNKNVIKCGVTGITFKREFKLEALKLYDQGLSGRQIFRQCGFDEKLINKEVARNALNLWRRTARRKGKDSLLRPKLGGGRPRKIERTEQEELRYLKAQVEYLKAENDFLVKLRAKKRAE